MASRKHSRQASSQLSRQLVKQAKLCKKAAQDIALATTKKKNEALNILSKLLLKNKDDILRANKKDISDAEKNSLSAAMIDRLRITGQSLKAMSDYVRLIARLEDPVGKILERRTLYNGLKLKKVSVPIGVILIIYESRPNVTIDAAALCIKSGNAVILKGGSDAINSNKALAKTVKEALERAGLPKNAVELVKTTERPAIGTLLKLNELIDLVIPRGGEGLIRYVVENSTIPVIMHYKGVCSVYVDKDADTAMAETIVINSKCQRPGVCNAAENLLVHKDIAKKFLPEMARSLKENGVRLIGCEKARKLIMQKTGISVKKATEKDWSTEYLDLVISIKVVGSLDEAIQFINRYGSHHTDAIVTKDKKAAEEFLNRVDSSTVFWNASTRFTDGGQFGMGAEMGISTQKIHARGPMALPELTSYKYVVEGKGQIRR